MTQVAGCPYKTNVVATFNLKTHHLDTNRGPAKFDICAKSCWPHNQSMHNAVKTLVKTKSKSPAKWSFLVLTEFWFLCS